MRAGLGAWWLRLMHLCLETGDHVWWDDGVAHFGNWGFELGAIDVPVQPWHGRLARNIPGCDVRLTDEDGQMTLFFTLRAADAGLLAHF